MPVQMALTPDGSWDLDAAGIIAAAAGAGFEAVGASARNATPETAAAYASTGIRCHELLALVLQDDVDAVLEQTAGLAEAAALLGAPWVLGVIMTPISDALADALPRVAAMLGDAGAGLAVEFVPMGPVATIPDALAVVELAGPAHAGVLVDTWHFFIGASTWDDLATLPLDRLAYVQFDDALPPARDHLMRETMRHRKLPGEGTFELDRFASTLLERGWDGTVSVEVLSDELRQLPVPEFARRAHEATSRFWR